jgi:hypothetical protein
MTIYDPDPNPKVEAARLAYIDAQTAFDALYAYAYAEAGEPPDAYTDSGFKAYIAEAESDAAYKDYDAAWYAAESAGADADAPELEPEAEL